MKRMGNHLKIWGIFGFFLLHIVSALGTNETHLGYSKEIIASFRFKNGTQLHLGSDFRVMYQNQQGKLRWMLLDKNDEPQSTFNFPIEVRDELHQKSQEHPLGAFRKLSRRTKIQLFFSLPRLDGKLPPEVENIFEREQEYALGIQKDFENILEIRANESAPYLTPVIFETHSGLLVTEKGFYVIDQSGIETKIFTPVARPLAFDEMNKALHSTKVIVESKGSASSAQLWNLPLGSGQFQVIALNRSGAFGSFQTKSLKENTDFKCLESSKKRIEMFIPVADKEWKQDTLSLLQDINKKSCFSWRKKENSSSERKKLTGSHIASFTALLKPSSNEDNIRRLSAGPFEFSTRGLQKIGKRGDIFSEHLKSIFEESFGILKAETPETSSLKNIKVDIVFRATQIRTKTIRHSWSRTKNYEIIGILVVNISSGAQIFTDRILNLQILIDPQGYIINDQESDRFHEILKNFIGASFPKLFRQALQESSSSCEKHLIPPPSTLQNGDLPP